MKLNVKAFSLTCALMWGLGLLVITWWIILIDGASGETVFISRIYRGYTLSLTGSLIGMAWALVDGAIGGAVFAWLYNFIFSRIKTG